MEISGTLLSIAGIGNKINDVFIEKNIKEYIMDSKKKSELKYKLENIGQSSYKLQGVFIVLKTSNWIAFKNAPNSTTVYLLDKGGIEAR